MPASSYLLICEQNGWRSVTKDDRESIRERMVGGYMRMESTGDDSAKMAAALPVTSKMHCCRQLIQSVAKGSLTALFLLLVIS